MDVRMSVEEAQERVRRSDFRFYGGYGEEICVIIDAVKNGYKLYKEDVKGVQDGRNKDE